VLGRTKVTGLMREEHLFAARRKPRPHRRRRERRAHFGELLQMGTSEHDWFEGRAPACSLIDMIDDATGVRLVRFFASDTTEANFDMIRQWIEAFGRPRDLYTDQANHFRPTQQTGKRPSLSQIERALRTLGIGLIIARSPQAKGRVERHHGIDQDRLIKEMRLRGISGIEAANRFLEEIYLPRMNERFAVRPRRRRDAHRSAARFDLASILCPHETRRVAQDHTVSIDGALWQIEPDGPSLAGQTLVVERRLDGTLRLRHGQNPVRFGRAARAGEMGATRLGIGARRCKAARSGRSGPARCPQFPSPGDGGDKEKSSAQKKRTLLCGAKADISMRR